MKKEVLNHKKIKKDRKIEKDIDILSEFINIFCVNNHKQGVREQLVTKGVLGYYLNSKELCVCGECKRLLLYAVSMLLACPYDPKPQCKKCKTHCYREPYRQQVRQVMKYSGIYLLRHGRLDLLGKYLL